MKKAIPYIIILFFIFGFVRAQSIRFETGDWISIKQKAREQNKLIFVDAYTTSCGPCKWMDKNTFTNDSVGLFFNTHFISYKIDAEKGEGVDFAKAYDIVCYPNLLFIDGQGTLVIRKASSFSAKPLIALGQKAVNAHKKLAMTLEYNKGNRTPQFILEYLAFLFEIEEPTDEIATWYLAMQGQKQWISEENLNLINYYIENPYGKVIEFLINHRDDFVKINPQYYQSFVPAVIKNKYEIYLKEAIFKKDDIGKVNQLLSHANLRLKPEEAAYLKSFAKRITAKRDEDWVSYASHTIDYVNGYLLENYQMLNSYAWMFYENQNIKDEQALRQALKWVNIALEDNNNNYAAMDTKAALLYKLGKEKEALEVAEIAVKIAKKIGADSTDTFKLIEKIKVQGYQN